MKFLVYILLALLVAGPALADKPNRSIKCTTFLSLAATNDNTPLFLAPVGGGTLKRMACYTDPDVTTPAVISFEDGAANDVTHATLTCTENGGTPTWIPATAGNSFVQGEAVVFDVDNASDTQPYTICVDFQGRQ